MKGWICKNHKQCDFSGHCLNSGKKRCMRVTAFASFTLLVQDTHVDVGMLNTVLHSVQCTVIAAAYLYKVSKALLSQVESAAYALAKSRSSQVWRPAINSAAIHSVTRLCSSSGPNTLLFYSFILFMNALPLTSSSMSFGTRTMPSARFCDAHSAVSVECESLTIHLPLLRFTSLTASPLFDFTSLYFPKLFWTIIYSKLLCQVQSSSDETCQIVPFSPRNFLAKYF